MIEIKLHARTKTMSRKVSEIYIHTYYTHEQVHEGRKAARKVEKEEK